MLILFSRIPALLNDMGVFASRFTPCLFAHTGKIRQLVLIKRPLIDQIGLTHYSILLHSLREFGSEHPISSDLTGPEFGLRYIDIGFDAVKKRYYILKLTHAYLIIHSI